jgi:hypothetical protein
MFIVAIYYLRQHMLMKENYSRKLVRITLSVCAGLSCLLANAQQSITGRITDTKNVPVTYAILTLKSTTDSMIIKNEVTDSLGHYTLSADSFNNTILVVNAMGFGEQKKVIIEAGKPYDFILAEQNNQLNEVVISGTKPLIERKIDRTIFNVSQSISAIGGDALDAIKKAPGVSVSNDAIALIGKGSVNILIDGKLLQLSGDDLVNYLKSISADNINRIEIITTPPAQYDAAGNSGLINVVLKKDKRDGMNGTVRAGYQQASLGTIIAGAGLNYHKNKISLNAGLNYNYGAVKPVENSVAYFPTQTFESKDLREDKRNFIQSSVGIDYELHKGGILGIQYIGMQARPDMLEQSTTLVKNGNNLVDSTLSTNANGKRKYLSNSINLNYAWDIDSTGKKLSANVNRMWYSADQDRHYVSQNYTDSDVPTAPANDNKAMGSQTITITTAQIDVTHPTKFFALSYGGKLSFIDNNSNNSFLALHNDVYQKDDSLSNQFNYEEKVQALYFSASKEIGKWSFQAGLRGEFTQTKGQSVRINQTNTNNYFQLFPTAYIQYSINVNNVFNINYSKRIERPGYSSLDPFRWYVTPYMYAEGNPFLQPSFNHNFELSYTFKQRYSFTAYYQRNVHAFGQANRLDTVSNIQIFRSDNLGTANSYGFTANATINPTPWWEMQVGLGGYYSRFTSTYYDGVERGYGRPSFSVDNNNSFTLNKAKTFFAEVSFDYSSPSQSQYYEAHANGSVNAGFKLLLLDKQLTLALSANDILATDRYRAQNIYNQTTIDNYYDKRNLRLTMTYKLGSKKLKEVRQRDTGIEAEAGRAN